MSVCVCMCVLYSAHSSLVSLSGSLITISATGVAAPSPSSTGLEPAGPAAAAVVA